MIAGDTLPLSEVFGPTWQGEGVHLGKRCAFVRLGLCNLACEWCDTPYTWDTTRYDVKKECPDTPVDEIHDQLRRIDASLVVLSGGEPMLHVRKEAFFQLLDGAWSWHVETNGTIAPPDWWFAKVLHTTVSPKVSTRDPLRKRIKPAALEAWAQKAKAGCASFKFVVTDPEQLDVIDQLVHNHGIPRHAVYIMPEGTTPETVLEHHRTLAPHVLERGYATTTRLQTLLWGDERGH